MHRAFTSRLGDWSRRWPDVFGDMSGPWLSYLRAVERAYLAVWAAPLRFYPLEFHAISKR